MIPRALVSEILLQHVVLQKLESLCSPSLTKTCKSTRKMVLRVGVVGPGQNAWFIGINE